MKLRLRDRVERISAMMIKGIDFPDTLIRASKEGKLVVFAGAGVSKAPPSNYPDFEGLTDEIAKGHPLKKGKLDVDRFLGRLKDTGVAVHNLAREILSNPKSKPNSLHFDLLKMFPPDSGIRLITTNFDMHFSAASQILFGPDVPTGYYPELPPARNFQGICYLHGCVARDHANMVLYRSGLWTSLCGGRAGSAVSARDFQILYCFIRRLQSHRPHHVPYGTGITSRPSP